MSTNLQKRKANSDDLNTIRRKRSFTERAQYDNITLPLVLSFLEICSLVKCRRVCRTWRYASTQSLSWENAILNINIEYLTSIPISSISLLRNISILKAPKVSLYDLDTVFQYLGNLSMLRTCRIEELEFDRALWNRIAKYLPNLQNLNLRMTNFVKRDTDLEQGDLNLRMDSFVKRDTDLEQEDLNLRMPNLKSLKLPKIDSATAIAAVINAVDNLETLSLKYSNTLSNTLETERSLINTLNSKFEHSYRYSLKRLSIESLYHHDYFDLNIEKLTSLTALSITHNSKLQAISTRFLVKLSKMENLRDITIKVHGFALSLCEEREWWKALASIQYLTSVSFWNLRNLYKIKDVKLFTEGIDLLFKNPQSRLRKVQLCDIALVDDFIIAKLCDLKLLDTISITESPITTRCLESLAKVTKLKNLEIVSCINFNATDGLMGIIKHLPKLESLILRLKSAASLNSNIISPSYAIASDDVWEQLLEMRSLRFLYLTGYAALSDSTIDSWCAKSEYNNIRRQQANEASLKRFLGFEPNIMEIEELDNPNRPAPKDLLWQEIRFSGWMLSYKQSIKLLKSFEQLHLMSVHLLEESKGLFQGIEKYQPRLVFGGGDYLERSIAQYTFASDNIDQFL